VELRQLACFVAVADELNFSRAAERMHMSQPPLSRQIARLEDELRVRLLDRSPKHVALTVAGQGFLPEARRLLELAKRAPESARRAESGETGSLRIGFVGSTIYTSVPALVGRFRKLYPAVDLTLLQMMGSRQIDMVLAGDLDIGIIRQPASHPQLKTLSLFREPFVLAVSTQHPLARQPTVNLRQLSGENFVAFSRQESPVNYEQLCSICEKAGFSPSIAMEAHPMSTIVGLVASGAGVAIVPQSMRRLKVLNVTYKKLTGTRAHSEFLLVWRRDSELATVNNFLRLEREQPIKRLSPP